MTSLENRVAVVTGASRGVGRGIALGLGEAGASVWLLGRTLREGDGDAPGSLEATAAAVEALGGRPTPLRCDLLRDADTEAAFERVLGAEGRLDLLVNAAWGGYERMVENGAFTWPAPFWEQPRWRWGAMFDAGVRAAFVASALAAPAMVRANDGLIVNLSYWAARKHLANAIYGAAKAATDKLTHDMARELRPHGVTVVSLYPGLVRTEAVMANAEHLDLSNSESPTFSGRAVAALAADPERLSQSGEVLVAAELARRYGFDDVDGRRPRPLTIDDA